MDAMGGACGVFPRVAAEDGIHRDHVGSGVFHLTAVPGRREPSDAFRAAAGSAGGTDGGMVPGGRCSAGFKYDGGVPLDAAGGDELDSDRGRRRNNAAGDALEGGVWGMDGDCIGDAAEFCRGGVAVIGG